MCTLHIVIAKTRRCDTRNSQMILLDKLTLNEMLRVEILKAKSN